MKFGHLVDFLVKAVSTVFFIGYLPLIPGTFGSLVGVGLFYLIKAPAQPVYFLVIFCVMCLGLLTAGRTEKLLNKKDPGCIVIDEVMGMLVALSFIPVDLKLVILGFIIFRILDTLKVFPAERLQQMHGSVGVMGDDLVAGIFTNITLQLILRFS
ncbi:MAG: phosphatidylglycerophosphatase A [Candidatus Omnitrophota bacterium]